MILDRETLAPLEARAQQRGWAFHVLPELPEDVHDLAGLDAVGALLAES